MEAKVGTTPTPSCVEFEPFCNWQREDARDILVIHLPEFKKDQLKVQINNYGILKISGERQVNAATKSKFYKEVVVPKNCITSDIHAKFVNGCLYITMPKRFTPAPEQVKPLSVEDQKPETKTSHQDQVNKSTSDESGCSTQEDTDSSSDGNAAKDLESHQPKKSVSKMKRFRKVAINIAAILTVLSAFSAYFIYMYRSVIVED